MSSADWYPNFAKLAYGEREDKDYRVVYLPRLSNVVIMAPHGGTIEPHTSEVAGAIAGTTFTLYLFEALTRGPHARFHISSERFDEPQALQAVEAGEIVVTVHGLNEAVERVDVGGLNTALRDRIIAGLRAVDFPAAVDMSPSHGGRNPRNICNRGRSARGVQLELGRGLRDRLASSSAQLSLFADAVREVVAHA